MSDVRQLTAVIEREGDGYVATCPELDIVSQGNTVEEARLHLLEAVEGFFEVASPSEIQRRWKWRARECPGSVSSPAEKSVGSFQAMDSSRFAGKGAISQDYRGSSSHRTPPVFSSRSAYGSTKLLINRLFSSYSRSSSKGL
jgi:predicted RNase H-like HicB family nuclease